MASNNPKKFWKRKTDGKLILNPLNQSHLIMCSNVPCGQYWAIFGKKKHYIDRIDGNVISEGWYFYDVGIYFVKDGKAQWIDDQNQSHCASIDINGRPNGRQRYIWREQHSEQETPQDEEYDQENDEWIYIPATYVTYVYQEQIVTEWYRISPCYQSKEKAFQAFYYPCGITETPFPDENSTEWADCLKNHWLQKTVKVTAPIYQFRRELMQCTYRLLMNDRKRNTIDVTYNYQYNPSNDQICTSASSQCISASLTSIVLDTNYEPWTIGTSCWMLSNGNEYYDYHFTGETAITDRQYLTCHAYAKAYQTASNTLAPYIYNKLQQKQTFLDSYYYGYRYINTNKYQYYFNDNWPPSINYSSGGMLTHNFNYDAWAQAESYTDTRIRSNWGRFVFKKTNQTPSEATGIKVEITIRDEKRLYNNNSSSSSVSTSSFASVLQFDKYYQDLPFPTYFTIFNLLKNYSCITESDDGYTWDHCDSDNDGCTIQFQPGYGNPKHNEKREAIFVNVKVIDVNFTQDYINAGYPMQGELNYGN